MAIKNEQLSPVKVQDYRRPDLGNPRALGAAIERFGTAVSDVYGAYKTSEVVGDLEEERVKFLAEQGQTGDDAKPDEDVFNEFAIPQAPTSKEIEDFSSKMLRLNAAQKSGAINHTELKIRQEKILREAMAARPWLADDFVRAASATQGYNPIGSEVQAAAEAERQAGIDRKQFQDKVINQMISAGTPAYLLQSNPSEFFRIGIGITNDAMQLTTAQMASQITDLKDKGSRREVNALFNRSLQQGVLATLPAKAYQFVNDWAEATASGAYARSPELQQVFDERKAAMIREYAIGGSQYNELYSKMVEVNPHLDLSEFDAIWKNRVESFFGMLAKAGTAEEARAASNFLTSQAVRTMYLDHPDMQVTLEIAKALGSFANNPALAEFGQELTNRMLPTIATIFTNTTFTKPNGDVVVNPVVTTASGGSQAAMSGKPAEAEAERKAWLWAGDELIRSDDPKAKEQGLAAITVGLNGQSNDRANGIQRPSVTVRTQFANMMASQDFATALGSVPPEMRLPVQEAAKREIRGITQDLAMDVRKDFQKRFGASDWDNAKKLEAYVDGGSYVKFRPRKDMDDRGAQTLADQLNNQYGSQFNLLRQGWVNVGSTDVKYGLQADVLSKAYADIVTLTMFGVH